MLNNLVFEQRCAASLHECEIVYLFIQLIEIIKYWTTWFTFGLGMFVQILDHCLPKTWRQLPCLLTQVQPPIKRRPRIIHGSIWPVTMPSPARHTSGDLPFFSFLVVYSPLPVMQKRVIPHPQAPDQPHIHTCQLSHIRHQSSGLAYGSP